MEGGVGGWVRSAAKLLAQNRGIGDVLQPDLAQNFAGKFPAGAGTAVDEVVGAVLAGFDEVGPPGA